MSLPDGNLCYYKERGCYPGWGFSGGTPDSSGRMSSGARSQNAPRGAQGSAVRRLTDCSLSFPNVQSRGVTEQLRATLLPATYYPHKTRTEWQWMASADP